MSTPTLEEALAEAAFQYLHPLEHLSGDAARDERADCKHLADDLARAARAWFHSYLASEEVRREVGKHLAFLTHRDMCHFESGCGVENFEPKTSADLAHMLSRQTICEAWATVVTNALKDATNE